MNSYQLYQYAVKIYDLANRSNMTYEEIGKRESCNRSNVIKYIESVKFVYKKQLNRKIEKGIIEYQLEKFYMLNSSKYYRLTDTPDKLKKMLAMSTVEFRNYIKNLRRIEYSENSDKEIKYVKADAYYDGKKVPILLTEKEMLKAQERLRKKPKK